MRSFAGAPPKASRPHEPVDFEPLAARHQRGLAAAPEVEVLAAGVVEAFKAERGELCPDVVARIAAATLAGVVAVAQHTNYVVAAELVSAGGVHQLHPAQRHAAVRLRGICSGMPTASQIAVTSRAVASIVIWRRLPSLPCTISIPIDHGNIDDGRASDQARWLRGVRHVDQIHVPGRRSRAPGTLRARIRLLGPRAEETMMTIAEQFIEEGRIASLRSLLIFKFKLQTLDRRTRPGCRPRRQRRSTATWSAC